ncbi:MAG: hypothetical protein AB7U38_11525 [Hyphomicrobiales bacterium]
MFLLQSTGFATLAQMPAAFGMVGADVALCLFHAPFTGKMSRIVSNAIMPCVAAMLLTPTPRHG